MSYYADKLASLADIFGSDDVRVTDDALTVNGASFPIIDDVIVLLEPDGRPPSGQRAMPAAASAGQDMVQFTFGRQWRSFSEILPEHEAEFHRYFDLVRIDDLSQKRCVDLGCGIGRWSYFVAPHCREVVLVDFSDAIFVARKNLRSSNNALFFMGDLTRLPFRRGFADFLFSLGVLHHLRIDCLGAARSLARYSNELLVYLYYALDNRPAHFRPIYRAMDYARRRLSRIRSEPLRQAFSYGLVWFAYWPFIGLGRLAQLANLGHQVPLYEYYRDKSFERIRQDAYDRFFTPVEQRVTRRDIERLADTFSRIEISEHSPYWHFLAKV